jgi:stalled ribosome alternative rescue factor ArfA
MPRNMKSRGAAGRLQPARNVVAKALAEPLFRQRVVKSKKAYKREQNQTLSKVEQNQ